MPFAPSFRGQAAHGLAVVLVLAASALTQASCVGNGVLPSSEANAPSAGGTATPTTPTTPAGPVTYAPARVRMLVPQEMTNSLQDVFTGGAALNAAAPATAQGGGGTFDNRIDGQGVTAATVETLRNLAEAVSTQATQGAGNLYGTCAAGTQKEAACLSTFLDTVGKLAYRHTLSSDERASLTALFTTTRQSFSYADSMASVISAMIQSPQFVFRTELGAQPGVKLTRLTPLEMASAMAYFFWRSAPDAALIDAAEGGQLSNPNQIAVQAHRMFHDPKAQVGAWSFFSQWMSLGSADGMSAAHVAQYPNFTSGVAASALEETRQTIIRELFTGQANWKTLLTQSSSPINSDLATIYGVTAPSTAGFIMTPLDPNVRAGIFTQSSFVSSEEKGSGFSPVALGLYVSSQLFCNVLPSPPPNIPALPTGASAPTTRRGVFAAHSTNPTCAACHHVFEPMGWGFEQLNGVGGFQSMDGTTPLTGAGTLVGTDVDGPFAGPVQLMQRTVSSAQAANCFSSRWLEYAVGRPISTKAAAYGVDTLALQSATSNFVATQTNIENLVTSIVQSDAFALRDASSLPQAQTP